MEALTKLEPRIEVETSGIDLTDSLDEVTGKNFLHITIHYTVVMMNKESSTTVTIGG